MRMMSVRIRMVRKREGMGMMEKGIRGNDEQQVKQHLDGSKMMVQRGHDDNDDDDLLDMIKG